MNDHERILRLRPANVVGRLGQGSTLPILEPRRLGRALLERRVPLLCVPVLIPPVMAGLLRAARELDAVIGLSCPALYERPVAAEAFITALKNEGEGLHRKPFFLQAGPLRLNSSSPAALEQAYAVACKLLDAGFSLLSLDGSRLGVANSVQACRDLVQATMGKGVAVELTAPRNAGGRTSAEGLRNYLQSLEKAGARPDFMRVGVPLPEEEQRHDGLDTALLGELAAVASRFGVELTVADRGRTSHSEFVEWARVGARKLDAGDTFSRIVLDALPEDVSKGLLAHAEETQIPVADLLGASESILQGLDARTQDRLEALSFADALALLGALRAANSATESMSWLVENGLHAH
ncbi:hypothetical protein [Hyalangium sp.]|uniref:hypothetical protein n=1 Tax=Hyalangium sp. TaxID=2028555 RepID=UPI002D236753|nr:hypothetical protein [Hyalangium sp.]HYH97063.1 hypothetical protein [Hyalangium sp.]